MSFKLRSLFVAVAGISAFSAHGAGLDRSTQPSWGLTQDGTFAYVEHITISPEVAGKDSASKSTGNMSEDYNFLNFGAKADINDRVSIGAFFDQPWGADVQFKGDNNFVSPTVDKLQDTVTAVTQRVNKTQLDLIQQYTPAVQAGKMTQADLKKLIASKIANESIGVKAVASTVGEGTSVTVSSQNATLVGGIKLGKNNNFQVYAGPTIQKLEGDIHLRGMAYGVLSGYDAYIPNSNAYGWLAGVAYSKPEIALKASLTYRSEIDHDATFDESIPESTATALTGFTGSPVALPHSFSQKATITTPESYNLDFQTGLNPTTLLTAKVRYVPWGDFKVTPPAYHSLAKNLGKNLNIVDYSDDAWTAEIGLGKKLSPKWAVSGSVGWDSGAGNPASSLGPVEGNWNVGLGAKYNITPEWSVSGGAKYLMFGDATAQLPDHATNVGEFADNDGFVYGLRLTYQKK
ncbi:MULTISPECIES: outer membrane protein transport protein [unclassified Moraxella]|uniref:outer membrane protein transport protein n=1 Tax=unclassified Moraxella TaxID=2685852 RepID=UPI003AF97C95